MYVCGVVHIRKRGKGEKRGGIRYRVGEGFLYFCLTYCSLFLKTERE